jgi:hypothetical protein
MFDLEEAVEKIPLWVKWLLLVGGALMSAFASRLPDSIQALGLEIGVISAFLGCIGLTYHFANEWRERRGKPRIKLEPSHLIILGLVLAVVGTGWLLYGTRAASITSTTTNVTAGPVSQQTPPLGDLLTITHLNLKFGHGSDLPVATANDNIWRWYALANVFRVIGKDGQSADIRAWTIFVTFDRSLDPKQIAVTSKGSLPTYEVKERDYRSAVIAFSGDLVDIDVDIRVEGRIVANPQQDQTHMGFTAGPAPDRDATIADLRKQIEELKNKPLWNANGQTAADNPYPQSILTTRYYSKKNKEDIAEILDKTADVFNKQGKDIFDMAEVAINGSAWDRPGENLDPMIDKMLRIEALSADFKRDLFEVLYRDNPEYRIELNSLLFPAGPPQSFEGAAKSFRNALAVWREHRDAIQGDQRREFVDLIQTARAAFGRSRDEFLKWEGEREAKINQTRMALRQ